MMKVIELVLVGFCLVGFWYLAFKNEKTSKVILRKENKDIEFKDIYYLLLLYGIAFLTDYLQLPMRNAVIVLCTTVTATYLFSKIILKCYFKKLKVHK